MSIKGVEAGTSGFVLLVVVMSAIGIILVFPLLDAFAYRYISEKYVGNIVAYSIESTVHTHSGGPGSGSRLWISLNPNAKVSFINRDGVKQYCTIGHEIHLNGKRYDGNVSALEEDLSYLSTRTVAVHYSPRYEGCRIYLGVGEKPWRIWFGVLWLSILSLEIFVYFRERKNVVSGANNSLKADRSDERRP